MTLVSHMARQSGVIRTLICPDSRILIETIGCRRFQRASFRPVLSPTFSCSRRGQVCEKREIVYVTTPHHYPESQVSKGERTTVRPDCLGPWSGPSTAAVSRWAPRTAVPAGGPPAPLGWPPRQRAGGTGPRAELCPVRRAIWQRHSADKSNSTVTCKIKNLFLI